MLFLNKLYARKQGQAVKATYCKHNILTRLVLLQSVEVSFFFSKGFKVSLPHKINCIFFAMASSDNTNQLSIVSYVLASGHDLVTRWWVHRTATPKAATQSGQLTWTWQAGWGPLLQTANDKLSIWQGHWDSHFHVDLQKSSSLPAPLKAQLQLTWIVYSLQWCQLKKHTNYIPIIDCFSCAFILSWPCD